MNLHERRQFRFESQHKTELPRLVKLISISSASLDETTNLQATDRFCAQLSQTANRVCKPNANSVFLYISFDFLVRQLFDSRRRTRTNRWIARQHVSSSITESIARVSAESRLSRQIESIPLLRRTSIACSKTPAKRGLPSVRGSRVTQCKQKRTRVTCSIGTRRTSELATTRIVTLDANSRSSPRGFHPRYLLLRGLPVFHARRQEAETRRRFYPTREGIVAGVGIDCRVIDRTRYTRTTTTTMKVSD